MIRPLAKRIIGNNIGIPIVTVSSYFYSYLDPDSPEGVTNLFLPGGGSRIIGSYELGEVRNFVMGSLAGIIRYVGSSNIMANIDFSISAHKLGGSGKKDFIFYIVKSNFNNPIVSIEYGINLSEVERTKAAKVLFNKNRRKSFLGKLIYKTKKIFTSSSVNLPAVTVTTALPHGYVLNDLVNIEGNIYRGIYPVAEIVSSTAFKIVLNYTIPQYEGLHGKLLLEAANSNTFTDSDYTNISFSTLLPLYTDDTIWALVRLLSADDILSVKFINFRGDTV